MQEALETFAFLVFLVVCAGGAAFLYFILPETKNKTFMEISESFAKINKVSDSTPDKEMEMALSITPRTKETTNGTVGSIIEMESSF